MLCFVFFLRTSNPVNVSRSWMGTCDCEARCFRGTTEMTFLVSLDFHKLGGPRLLVSSILICFVLFL